LRALYSLLLLLLLPVILLVLWARGFGKQLSERFGRVSVDVDRVIWLHAASVGEVNAAVPLIEELREKYSGCPLLITTFTPTGAQRARELTRLTVPVRYLPLDTGFAVRRFLNAVKPRALIVMETEIWPNLFRECTKRGVPVMLASARLSEKSVRGYQRFGGLIRPSLAGVKVAAQTATDMQRFIDIGVEPDRVSVTGNLKLAFKLPETAIVEGQSFREQHAANRPVWIAASTHEGEEEQVLEAHKALLEVYPAALLILVPRHPDRFDKVAELLRRSDLSFIKRSRKQVCDRRTQVFLGDSMGELLMYYAAADIAFVGGSFADIGGHNLLEPATMALPLLTGPHNYNDQTMADLMHKAGALQLVADSSELADVLCALLDDDEARIGKGAAALKVTNDHGATLERLMEMISPAIPMCRRRRAVKPESEAELAAGAESGP